MLEPQNHPRAATQTLARGGKAPAGALSGKAQSIPAVSAIHKSSAWCNRLTWELIRGLSTPISLLAAAGLFPTGSHPEVCPVAEMFQAMGLLPSLWEAIPQPEPSHCRAAFLASSPNFPLSVSARFFSLIAPALTPLPAWGSHSPALLPASHNERSPLTSWPQHLDSPQRPESAAVDGDWQGEMHYWFSYKKNY